MPKGGETKGEALARLRTRAGLSMDEIAKAGGYRGRSSVQRFFSPEYDPVFIPMELAQRLSKSMEGKGNPPISIQELFSLAGVSLPGNADTFPGDQNIGALPRNVPVYGTALGGEASFDSTEGTGSLSVEQAELDQSEVLGYLRRPPALEGRQDVYGVYVAGMSMYPRFNDGEAVFVDPKRPPMIGDDVIVSLVGPDSHDGERVVGVLIKRLKRRTAAYIELEQFTPALTFRLERARVKEVHRIIPTGELLS
jgi:phage repressor protein C with HTH and peptisase S24 domain